MQARFSRFVNAFEFEFNNKIHVRQSSHCKHIHFAEQYNPPAFLWVFAAEEIELFSFSFKKKTETHISGAAYIYLFALI